MSKITEEKIDFLRDLVLAIESRFPFAKFKGRIHNKEGERNGVMIKMFDDIWHFIISEDSKSDLVFLLTDTDSNYNRDPSRFPKFYKGMPNYESVGKFIKNILGVSIFVEVIDPNIEEISNYFYTYYFKS